MLYAAEIQTDTLGRSLLIALVVVSPYAIHKIRQVRAVRRERDRTIEAADAPPPPSRPGLEEIIGRISEDQPSTITIPTDVTVDGSDAPPGVVDALVRDALRRSGLVATAEVETPAGRVLELHPAPPTPST